MLKKNYGVDNDSDAHATPYRGKKQKKGAVGPSPIYRMDFDIALCHPFNPLHVVGRLSLMAIRERQEALANGASFLFGFNGSFQPAHPSG
jgi:hypothetical protein